MENSKSIHELCLNSFFKKAASYAILLFLLCIDRCDMKNVQPLLFFFSSNSFHSPCVYLYETSFPYEGGHSIAHLIFKTCVQ